MVLCYKEEVKEEEREEAVGASGEWRRRRFFVWPFLLLCTMRQAEGLFGVIV